MQTMPNLMQITLRLVSALTLWLSSTAYAAQQSLCNYLGTGSQPNLTLQLQANGGNSWGHYRAGYGNCQTDAGAGIPTHPQADKQWSVWNIYDENNNYYGTLTLLNNGSNVRFEQYSNEAKTGYYIDGLDVKQEPHNPNQWIIRVSDKGKIVTPDKPADAGPFANTPRATPAVYALNTGKPYILTVKGNQIVDNEGNVIMIRGMARPSLEWNKQGQFLSEDDLLNMKKWGANTIRLSLKQKSWLESESVDVKGSYKQIVDALIYHATQNGMAVIIDLHWLDKDGQDNMAFKRSSVQFWQDVARQYKDYGTVMFELFNEPVIDKDVWLKGNATYVGYQELVDAIRATGANNICIVNGTEWGFNLDFVNASDNYHYAIKGENIVYGAHPYQRSYEQISASLQGVINKYPVIFTEFGDNIRAHFPATSKDTIPDTYKQSYTAILKYIGDHQIHYTAWAWWVEDGKPDFPTLIADWAGTPLNGGVLVKQAMEVNPGTPLLITSSGKLPGN
ncbi:glycoside hydrolase family 5 protein [Legionella erythra]|uniref:Endoglucanase n=1 Tax=Legionella erythra TaxID=448 RepID=A0A0W0TSA7_LEGER|nr:cellulase family glycosylhydrolase [Legionella erythra]KTC98627.1 Endoglucanase precursor [Legionella erythra]